MFNRNHLLTRFADNPLLFSKPVNYLLYRQTSQIRTVAMENMEEIPMTGGTNGRDEDAENQAHNLGNSRGELRAAKAEARMPTLP